MTKNVLEAHHLNKSFGQIKVLNDISLELTEGEILGVLGPNGAGKSTLLHTLCGLITPDAGEIRVLGTTQKHLKSKMYTYLSALLEDSSLTYMYLKGWDNLYYQGALYGFTRTETKKRALPLMDMLTLTEHMDKKVGDWSRGTQQKLALVTALLPSPKILLLDEPTLGLDVVSKRQFIDTVRSLAKEKHVAVLITSHQSDVIEALAQKILFIEKGTSLWSGDLRKFITCHTKDTNQGLEDILYEIFSENDINEMLK